MEATHRTERDGMPAGVPGESRLWLLPVAVLTVWQGWMTLTLFGPERHWDSLHDARPVLSGQHPLHLYHGYLGARAFLRSGSTSCYDPHFQAGYPKTPVFDGGSRPAELFLTLCGGEWRPDAYKIGLALCCLIVPFVLSVASRGAGLSRRGVFLSVLIGLVVWWGRPCQQALQDGDLDVLMGSLAALALAGMLIRFDRKPGARAFLGTITAGLLGWFFHPLLLGLLLPIYLVYYLSVGARHRLIWSLLLLAGLFVAVAANFFWLRDWIGYWWLRVPLNSGELLLTHRTLPALWRAPLWGETLDRGLALLLILMGGAGAVVLNERGSRPAARVFGLSSLLLILLAMGGILNDMLGKFRTSTLLIPGLLFAVPLASHGVEWCWRRLTHLTGQSWMAFGIASVPLGGILLLSGVSHELTRRARAADPLHLGLGASQQGIVKTLEKSTTAEARILWETLPDEQTASGWTALLPLLTGRVFIGGLDAGSGIEHTIDALARQRLSGRLLEEWSDEELADYCRRYNIGWVVCWSAPAKERFARWSLARPLATLDSNAGQVFALQRKPSFVLKGQARWLGAEPSRIRLADVVPEEGEVVLSLHYQEGLVAAPARVKVERELDPRQDISFVRLRVTAPVAHLTLTWQK